MTSSPRPVGRMGRALLIVAATTALVAGPSEAAPPAAGTQSQASVDSAGAAATGFSGGAWIAAERSESPAVTAAALTMKLTLFKDGFSSPVYMAAPPDGSGRLFVVEQGGRIKVIRKDGTIPSTPVLNISANVSKGPEQGLLGLAFHPSFKTNGKFYVYFTRLNGDTAINEYRLSPPSSSRVTLGGRRVLTMSHPYDNHNGGSMAFGADGFLYIGTGDGGSGGDPGNRAQSVNSLLGKILRINVNGKTSKRGYLIPSSNPYVGRSGLDEIWARGLRNPWRFSIDSATGAIWIGDVGQDRYEEIDRTLKGTYKVGGRGKNYGWHVLEGRHCFLPSSGCSTSGKTAPLVEYSHAASSGEDNCSVTGGYVYRGNAYPALRGLYVFGDFCSGRIWTVRAGSSYPGTATLRMDTSLNISSFAVNASRELFVISLGGAIYRVGAS
jgi:glucose/arabinose dehydrogenase